MMDQGSPLARRRVLVVEDEPLIVMLLEDMLSDMQVEVVATADNVAAALHLVETLDRFDGAILDMNLHGKSVEPVADALARRNIPFVFASGYGSTNPLSGHANAPVLAKPFLQDALEQALVSLLLSQEAVGSRQPVLSVLLPSSAGEVPKGEGFLFPA